MKTSLRGICAMLAEEAIVLTTYNDGTGTLTIGAGHTAAAGAPKPTPGLKISLAEAINIFRNDLAQFERDILREVHVDLSQNQFDALVSWHFNTGRISKSTLTDKLNARNYAGAAAEFAQWNKSKGKVLNGLISRRQRETDIFLQGDYGAPVIRVIEEKGGNEERYNVSQIEELLGGTPRTEEDQSTEELLANPASSLLPISRPKQPAPVTRSVLAKFRDLIPPDGRANLVILVAVRGYYLNTMGKEAANDRGIYDDAIFIIEPDNVYSFNANTDPSRFGPGIARLKSRQAVRYRPGPHGFSRKGGPYPAFRQDSNCTVIRDQTGEDTDSPDRRFWINLHRGGNTTTSSLGCQTVPPHQWNEFKTLVDGLLKKHGQETFYYLLVEQEDIPKEDAPVATPILSNLRPPVADLPSADELMRSLQGRSAVSPDELAALQEALNAIEHRRKVVSDALQAAANLDPLSSTSDPTLTPINGMLGKTIGQALDGRKTLIGVVGMILTTILPIFFPQLAPVATLTASLVDAANNAAPAAEQASTLPRELMTAAFPAFAGVTAWGASGKIEKWVRALRTGLMAGGRR